MPQPPPETPLTRGARVVVAVLLLFDLWIVVECAAHVGAWFVPR